MPEPSENQRLHHLHRPFGGGAFGNRAEAFARFFGTPRYLIGQTVLVMVWIAANAAALSLRWDPYPFILLNLVFSLQAAYAAPLILLAQTRQAERDRSMAEVDAAHREQAAADALAQDEQLRALLEANTSLTARVERLTTQLHERLIGGGG
jgi:uncharacterized membrane protein